jgi:hypothetical protein
LNPKCRGDENIDFARFDLLEVPRGDFGSFGQLILRQTPAHPFAAHIGAEDLDSLPFFPGNGHNLLQPFLMPGMNDTYIVKRFRISLGLIDPACENRPGRNVRAQFAWNSRH